MRLHGAAAAERARVGQHPDDLRPAVRGGRAGLHFSGTSFKGGDYWVRDEIAKLRAAENQYVLVEKGLAEALDRPLGSGCVVSDFFTQAEWSLLSEATDSKETAQHHIAVRQSYLGDAVAANTSEKDVAKARADATNTYRSAAIGGHIKLIGLAGIGSGQPTGVGCAKAARPDGLLVAEMAANMLKTREQARQLAENRNVFGFDITLVPARPYSTAPNSATEGLLQEAYRLQKTASDLQTGGVANTRAFDTSQEKLIAAVDGVRNGVDNELSSTYGCTKSSPGGVTDAEFFGCVAKQSAYLQTCENLISAPTVGGQETPFDTCMKDPAFLEGDAKRSLRDLRGVWLQEAGIKKKIDNIAKRVELSNDANTLVVSTLIGDGVIQTAFKVAEALSDSEEIVVGLAAGTITKPGSIAAGVVAATAGASSTAASVIMQESGNHVEVQNMLLDESEAWVDLQAAKQAYLAKKSEFEGFLGDDLVVEARRQRAYLQNSPANDPSFRIVRDSSRVQLAKALEHAATVSYLAARRAEYERAARLSASNFRLSDIYRARTAEDIKEFLDNLSSKINSLPGSGTDSADYRISVAVNVLGLSDTALAKEGFSTPAAAQAERIRRFRIWVADNTITNHPDGNGKPVLVFKFATNVQNGGIFANAYGPGFTGLYLQKVAGVGSPIATNTGLSADVLSEQHGPGDAQHLGAAGGRLGPTPGQQRLRPRLPPHGAGVPPRLGVVAGPEPGECDGRLQGQRERRKHRDQRFAERDAGRPGDLGDGMASDAVLRRAPRRQPARYGPAETDRYCPEFQHDPCRAYGGLVRPHSVRMRKD